MITSYDEIVRTLTLIIDNTSELYHPVTMEVETLSTYSICGEMDHCGDHDPADPCTTMQDWPSVHDVGSTVAEWLAEWIEEHVPDTTARMMLVDLCDLGAASIHDRLGAHYYPEDAYARLKAAREV